VSSAKRPKHSRAKTHEEIRAEVLRSPGGGFDLYDTMAHFPCAGPHTVREVLDQLAAEGVFEKRGSRYALVRKADRRG